MRRDSRPPSSQTTWSPLLSGASGDRARVAIADIAAALREPAQRAALETADRQSAPLASGTPGAALFFGYKSLVDGSDDDADLADGLMDAAAGAIAGVAMGPSLYQGFSGVAWAESHLAGRLFERGDADAHGPINEALLQYVASARGNHEFDLIAGLAGLGVYALEQATDPASDPLLAAILRAMEESAEPALMGRGWRTPPDRLTESKAARHPGGVFDLGVAHGAGGVIGMLSATSRAGLRQVDALLRDAVRHVLAHQLQDDGVSVFPAWISPGHSAERTRLAWCYGDAGLAVVLLAAARALDDAHLEREALRVARVAAARPDDLSYVSDAGLCHGSAGLAHLFNRLYHATGDPRLAAAARRWFARVLDDRVAENGVAGWNATRVLDAGVPAHQGDPGFLTGAAGIGLALLAGISDVDPAWDRALVASIEAPGVVPSV